MDLSGSVIQWRGLTFDGTSGRFPFATLEGWEDLPDARHDDDVRPQQHGRFDADVFSDARHVMVTGLCSSATERDSMLAELKASFNFSAASLLPLTITHAGLTLTSMARLLRFKPTPANWAGGVFGWAAEWVCPDPLRYASPVIVSTGFPVAAGGLEYDLFTNGTTDTGYLEYGAASTTGQMLLTNPGTADVWPVFTVAGPVPAQGFELVSDSGHHVRFEGIVPTGSTLVIDSGAGTAVIDGYADRGGSLTARDWVPVPAGGSVLVTAINLGTFTTAQIAASFSPGWW